VQNKVLICVNTEILPPEQFNFTKYQ